MNTTEPDKGPILVIAGPTASGKSALALDAAERFNGAVINADSQQIYEELRILSARPGPEDMAKAPHMLYGVLSVTEPCSAGRWLGMAKTAVEAVRADGRLPIVVGGTGFYLKALMEGLSHIPEISPRYREKARRMHAELGGEAFYAELKKIDPGMAEKLHPSDSQRLIRAYEIMDATGRSLAEWQKDAPREPGIPGRHALIALMPPRAGLYAACEERFDAMIKGGALEEVRYLRDLGLDPALPALKGVGVRELMDHLVGNLTLAEAVEQAKTATRRYAKRQMTWIRTQMKPDFTLSAQYSKSKSDKIFNFIKNFVLTEKD